MPALAGKGYKDVPVSYSVVYSRYIWTILASGWEMPTQASKLGFWGDMTPKWGAVSTHPPKGI